MDTPYNKPNRWSYFNKHYPELTYSFGEEVAPAYGRCPGPCVQFFYATWLQ